jgi:hypothetical protein
MVVFWISGVSSAMSCQTNTFRKAKGDAGVLRPNSINERELGEQVCKILEYVRIRATGTNPLNFFRHFLHFIKSLHKCRTVIQINSKTVSQTPPISLS